MSESSSLDDFIAELRRRSVIKVAALYAAIAFALLQFADIAFPRLGLPDWTVTLILIVAAVGFPAALLLAWYFERSGNGLTTTHELTDSERASLPKGRVFDVVIILVLSALVGFLYLERFSGDADIEQSTANIENTDQKAVVVSRDKSIAVMPFENLSANLDNNYFAAGVHEDILTHLSKISDIRVISRTSVLKYSDKGAKTVLEIGEELNVSHVLEGSIRRDGDQVRVTVQLIDAVEDAHLWSENYDRQLDNIFAVQTDVAKQVAGQLQVVLDPETISRVEVVPTTNTDAYDLYLKGRAIGTVWGTTGIDEELDYYTQAIAIDPLFAQAHAGVSQNMVKQHQTGVVKWGDVRDRALVAAETALRLDPESSEAHLARAGVHEIDQEFAKAEAAFKRAIEFDPNHVLARFHIGRMLYFQGRLEEARKFLQEAVKLDPLAETPGLLLAQTYSRVDNLLAYNMTMKVLDLNPDHVPALSFAAIQARTLGDLQAMFDHLFHAVALEPRNLFMRNFLVFELLNIESLTLAQQQLEEAEILLPDTSQIYAMKLNFLMAEVALTGQYTPEFKRVARQWLDAEPNSSIAVRYYANSFRIEADKALAEENPSLARQLEEESLIYYERALSNFRRDDGQYIYGPESSWALTSYIVALDTVGRTEEANQLMARLLPELKTSTVDWARFHTFTTLGQLGRYDEALDALDDAVKNGWSSTYILDIYMDSGFQSLANNIRYLDIRQQLDVRNRAAREYVDRQYAQGTTRI